MLDWKEQWIDGEKFPFTPSVVDLYGVEAACDEILEHGLEASFAQHELAAKATRAGVQAMGLQLWACREEITAACATAITVPEGLDHQAGARPLPRALRRDDLGRAGRGQPRPHRAHGPDRALAVPDRRPLGARPHVRRPRRPGHGRRRRRGRPRGALAVGGGRRARDLAPFELHRPRSVEEATALLDEHGDAPCSTAAAPSCC